MICPQCQAEYQVGVLDCTDCKIGLVEGTLPPLKHHEKLSWALIAEVVAILATMSFFVPSNDPLARHVIGDTIFVVCRLIMTVFTVGFFALLIYQSIKRKKNQG